MRILFLDLDTLRPDHMGCYGYHRNTTPTLDGIAADAMRFEHYHCSNAPCLPSRAALLTGQFGFHTGVVNHGDETADMRSLGLGRDFNDQRLENGLFATLRKAGLHTASISTFPERHSAWWFNAGLNECYNVGGYGSESAEQVMPVVMDWLERHVDEDNWFLHLNLWDAHTPYRAPKDFGNPFESEPIPDWITDNVLEEHLMHVGPHSANEVNMYNDDEVDCYPRHPGSIKDRAGLKKMFDGYDCGIRYMDEQLGKVIAYLKEKDKYNDMVIIVTSDHGENMGELGLYGEHATADEITTRIPMLIKYPGMKVGVDSGFHYNLDLLPTLAELLGLPVYSKWDGKSYAKLLQNGNSWGHDYLVVEQCCHVCQRSVRFDDYIYIRTYHDGYHLFDDEMLFNLKEDFYEQHNLAQARQDVCAKACHLLTEWLHAQMLRSTVPVDPLWQVLTDGGPYHAKGHLSEYIKRLEATGRAHGANQLRERHPNE